MNPRRSTTTGSNSWRFALILIVLLMLVAGAVFVTLFANGFFTKTISREGQVAFPALARPVRAYDAITRTDLINPQTGQLNVIWLPKAQANAEIHRDLSQIMGRVVGRDKKAGYVLSERDFLPKGTRPGLSAGIPPGKRSLTVEVKAVAGMELLRQGDVFDLMAVLPTREDPESNIEQAALLGGVKPPDTRSGQLARQTGIKPLVIGGTMVAITQGASQSTKGAGELVVPAGRSRKKTKTEMVATIAIDPVEVSPLTEALGLEVKIFCVARSGHPDESPKEENSISLEGLVPVVTLSRPIEAFAPVHQDDLADAVTGRLNLYYFPPEKVQDEWLTGFNELNGRVLARNMSRGAIITEADLMPKGTLPGIASAAPPGMSVMTITDDRLSGMEELKSGNWFSVYQALPENLRPSFPLTDWATLHGAVASPEDITLQRELRKGVRMVVENVMLLKTSDEKQPDVVVALSADDVASLTQALNTEEPLFVAAHNAKMTTISDTPAEVVNLSNPELNTLPMKNIQFVNNTVSAQNSLVKDSKNKKTPAGYLEVPVTAKPVKAWSRLSVEDFIDPATGRPRIMLFPKDQVGDDWEINLNSLIDRIVKRDIKAGRSILKSDLAPIGSQPGPTSGIPTGMVGIHVTGDQVGGLDQATLMQPGGRFKLIVTHPYNLTDLGGAVHIGLTNGNAIEQAQTGAGLYTRADYKVLSDTAVLVEIGDFIEVNRKKIENRSETTSQSLLTPEGPVRTETTRSEPEIYELTIETRSYLFALNLNDVPALTEAISTNASIFAIPLPGIAEAGKSADDTKSVAPIIASEKSESKRVNQPTDFSAKNASSSHSNPTAATPVPRVIEHIRGADVTRDIWVMSPNNSSKSHSSP